MSIERTSGDNVDTYYRDRVYYAVFSKEETKASKYTKIVLGIITVIPGIVCGVAYGVAYYWDRNRKVEALSKDDKDDGERTEAPKEKDEVQETGEVKDVTPSELDGLSAKESVVEYTEVDEELLDEQLRKLINDSEKTPEELEDFFRDAIVPLYVEDGHTQKPIDFLIDGLIEENEDISEEKKEVLEGFKVKEEPKVKEESTKWETAKKVASYAWTIGKYALVAGAVVMIITAPPLGLLMAMPASSPQPYPALCPADNPQCGQFNPVSISLASSSPLTSTVSDDTQLPSTGLFSPWNVDYLTMSPEESPCVEPPKTIMGSVFDWLGWEEKGTEREQALESMDLDPTGTCDAGNTSATGSASMRPPEDLLSKSLGQSVWEGTAGAFRGILTTVLGEDQVLSPAIISETCEAGNTTQDMATSTTPEATALDKPKQGWFPWFTGSWIESAAANTALDEILYRRGQ
ncbi:MAG: hypothetical protein K1060chlam5_00884 [Candidatus Anoxychlamydiales bacterium]|nr:hypothetical protein [Candidatus Anoxychlamydiales bacterium]